MERSCRMHDHNHSRAVLHRLLLHHAADLSLLPCPHPRVEADSSQQQQPSCDRARHVEDGLARGAARVLCSS
eukprot:750707-Hanusia_phi.AAC.1